MSRVYLVDDHTIVRDGLRAMLEGDHHTVVGESGDLTVALGDILRLAPDVLLLDLVLEGRSGFELLDDLQRRKLPLRTIVLTMSIEPRDVSEALRRGAMGYMLKDSSRAELRQAIDSVLRGVPFLSAEVADLRMHESPGDDAGERLARLSPRERQIIRMVVLGQSSTAIGAALHLSPKTVDTYRSRLMTKLDVADVTALVRFAIRAGLISVAGR